MGSAASGAGVLPIWSNCRKNESGIRGTMIPDRSNASVCREYCHNPCAAVNFYIMNHAEYPALNAPK